MNRILVALLSAAFGLFSTASAAQDYPQKTIKMIVPGAAGSPPDGVGRLIAQKLSESLGRTVIVENRPGAGGIIGTDAVAKSVPDGYTLLLGTPSYLAISPALYSKVTYDPINSFAPISTIATTTYVMVANNSLPVRSVKELIALAKAKPAQLNYGAPTTGTPPYLIMEMFKKVAGVDIVAINYIGGAQSLSSLLANTVQVAVEATASCLPLIRAGKMKALFVASNKRNRQLPDVPSAPEAGLAELDFLAWYGVLAPKGTPNDIVKRLHGDTVRAVNELTETLTNLSLEPLPSTPEEFQVLLKSETVKWAALVKLSGAKAH